MANNYLEFSEAISDLTLEEKEWIEGIPKMEIFEDEIDYGDREFENQMAREKFLHAAFVETLKAHDIDGDGILAEGAIDLFPNFNCQIDSQGDWWLSTHQYEYGDVAHVAYIVQAFIKKFRPDMVFTMTWAEYCSKPRLGEFGGGWSVVNKNEMLFGGVWSEAEEHAEALRTGNFKA